MRGRLEADALYELDTFAFQSSPKTRFLCSLVLGYREDISIVFFHFLGCYRLFAFTLLILDLTTACWLNYRSS